MFKFDTTLVSTINFMTMAFDYLYVTSTKLETVNDKNEKPVKSFDTENNLVRWIGLVVDSIRT